ncbi:MAG: AzlC family ABC transporter permease [Roseburia sp.]|nr:AzlC family ABC transporter permease [Roseburia sp.]
MTEFKNGLKDGIPIALGYLAVSFSVGIMIVSGGMSALQGALMSLTNVTSAGQFAGIRIIAAGGALLEMALTQFIINLRYALMSLSLSQNLDKDVKLWQRFVIAFANTDEIFAVAMSRQRTLAFPYMLGLQLLPVAGWTGGTVLGAVACHLMPEAVSTAMNVMLYGMFIAVVIPEARKKRPVLMVSLLAVALSCLFAYVPALSGMSDGMVIIICTIVAAGTGALICPVKEQEEQ